MKKPEIEVVRFGAEDVIATSGAPKLVAWSNLGETKGDSIVTFGGKTYGKDSSTIVDDLKNYYEWSGSPSKPSVYFSIDSGKSYKTLTALLNDDVGAWAIPTDYNTTYTFEKLDNGRYWFYKYQ